MKPPKLMCVLAHPDDESLGTGGILAKYAAEGVETQLVCATRGQKGWKLGDYPGPEAVARHRAKELYAAAEVLGVHEVRLLNYGDGELDQVDPQKIVRQLADSVLELTPNVVVTFGPDGAYGHPDHIAISQFATAAIVEAATRGHRVSKLYYLAESQALISAYTEVFGDLKSTVDGVTRRFGGWEPWALTTKVDVSAHIGTVREAVHCHHSQIRDYDNVLALPEARWQTVFGKATLYRAFSLVNGGRDVEADLFTGFVREVKHVAA